MTDTPKITDMYVLDALPNGSVVLDKHGKVWQYRGGLWCSYGTAPHGSEWLAKKYAPLTLLDAVEVQTEPPAVTDEMVAAAAEAFYEADPMQDFDEVSQDLLPPRAWGSLSDRYRDGLRALIRAALEAAFAVSPKAQAEPPAEDDDAAREALDRAIGSVLFNGFNFPEVVQARLLGQDMWPLRQRLVLAILDAVTVSPKKGQDQ